MKGILYIMDMYNSHLRGVERKLAVFDADMENQINKLSTLYEMASLKSNQIYKDIETKVYLEGYDTNDMTYMYQEASEESVGKKKGILKKIFEWFAKIFKAIKEKIAGVFNKKDDDAEYEVPANTFKIVEILEKHFKSIKMALVKIKSGNFAGGLADLLKAALPEITLVASVIIVKKTKLLDALKKLRKMSDDTEDSVDGAESEVNDANDEDTVNNAQKALSPVQAFLQLISTHISAIVVTLQHPIKNAKNFMSIGKERRAAKRNGGKFALVDDGSGDDDDVEESVYDYLDNDDYSFYY